MKIHQGLAEGQVLQRIGRNGASARIIGDCRKTGGVLATIFSRRGVLKGWKDRHVGAAKHGKFSAVLANIPAGGPYRLVLSCDGATARIKTFFSGDVWLLAGQSNMQGVGDMTNPSKPHPLIRAFSMRREWRQARDPLHVLGESPDACHSEGRQLTPEQGEMSRRTAKKGVGVGVFFAREMLKRSGVPQGLIATAHGGTSMAQWDSALKDRGGDSHYSSMLRSVRATDQPVAGVLWYQGESDTEGESPGGYTEKMCALVAAVRSDLKQPKLPWMMVQIATVYGKPGSEWNLIREQQRLLPGKIRNLETVPAIDLPLDDIIHISATAFPALAARLARAADRLVYGNRRAAPMPRLRAIVPPHPKKAPRHIDVMFAHVPGGLRSAGLPRGFSLLDGEGNDTGAIFKVTLHGDTARLHLHEGVPSLPEDTTLAYGQGCSPMCTLTDASGCALPAFGPQRVLKPNESLPFIATWRVSPVVTTPTAPLGALVRPDLNMQGAESRTYGADGFINEHPRWEKAAGHGYFSAKITLPEPMKLKFMLGYDGPFRLWIDDEAFYTDLGGTNPCLPDEFSRITTLDAGMHTLTVAMDLKEGNSWGFFLRMRRCGLSVAEIRKGAFARPTYSI